MPRRDLLVARPSGRKITATGINGECARSTTLLVSNPTKLPTNVSLPSGTDAKRFARQVDLIKRLDDD
jgi:hypothetical protein